MTSYMSDSIGDIVGQAIRSGVSVEEFRNEVIRMWEYELLEKARLDALAWKKP